jgi:4-alpha-glucanotransferase
MDAWSITSGYLDIEGRWHPTAPETQDALRRAMRADGDHPPTPPPMWFVRPGEAHRLLGLCALALEDGSDLGVVAQLPPDLPIGYHRLTPTDGGPVTELVVTPGRMRLPARGWGVAVQLYAARSRSSWGIGDLEDLRALSHWAAGQGAALCLLNPLHAATPTVPQQPSPYFASSRLWRNVLYLRVPMVPGAERLGPAITTLDRAGRALDDGDRIDRDAVLRLKLDALDRIYTVAPPGEDFERWRRDQGPSLEHFARFCALAEQHGPSFRRWPLELRHPDSPAVTTAADALAGRVRFHAWCQWLLDRQLARAATAGPTLVTDLAIGFDADGADAWRFQDLLADGVRVGAPPDAFASDGQDWGLPPFIPWSLRAARYQPLRELFRAVLTHAGGVRIDHVMGLFRQFWIPPGARAADGAYVGFPADDLLDLLALEAARAGAFVIGEDLGTVEDRVRAELAGRCVLGTHVTWFADGGPASAPTETVAAVTTHDLPTVAGVWTGADAAWLGSHEDSSAAQATRAIRARFAERTGLGETASVADAVVAAHRELGASPARMVTAGVDDLVGQARRPNRPGTVDEWPNWRIPLPVLLDDLPEMPLVRRTVNALRVGRTGDADHQP